MTSNATDPREGTADRSPSTARAPEGRVAAAIRATPPAPGLPPAERPPFVASPGRYQVIDYRRTGASGLQLPAISLGLWHNFGEDRPLASQRAIVRRAFDLGITHFDLANNYGPPYGSAEENFGRILARDEEHSKSQL